MSITHKEPVTHSSDPNDRDPQSTRGHRRGRVAGFAVGLLTLGGVGAFGYNALTSGDNAEPDRVDESTSGPAVAGGDASESAAPEATESQAPEVLSPEEAIGIEQTTYADVNTREAASAPDILQQARQPISADTPLDEAVVEMGNKFNIYSLTGDEQVLASIFGAETAANNSTNLVVQVREIQAHSDNRFDYFKDYPAELIIDSETGEVVDVTRHESFEPLETTGDLSVRFNEHYNTNFERVDRSEVFENDQLDNPYVIEKTITFTVDGGNLVVSHIARS